ncbi:hypothetical protein FTV88_2198 [Heliorestis convoluta]|uniref:Uncharacterized protein n=2 Tax=Heliorestis convoluta TaxID=356322 RepID=A0A5Q2N3X4_9FIRM|nr:hypothetical protein FTV88_2198 [Heliorestis convoluta]
MVILPRNGNFVASVSDGIMAAFIAFLFSLFFFAFQTPIFALLTLGLLITLGDALFHLFLREKKNTMP